jgi:hypothetical protein
MVSSRCGGSTSFAAAVAEGGACFDGGGDAGVGTWVATVVTAVESGAAGGAAINRTAGPSSPSRSWEAWGIAWASDPFPSGSAGSLLRNREEGTGPSSRRTPRRLSEGRDPRTSRSSSQTGPHEVEGALSQGGGRRSRARAGCPRGGLSERLRGRPRTNGDLGRRTGSTPRGTPRRSKAPQAPTT